MEIAAELLRSFLHRFDEVRDDLPNPNGWGGLSNGVRIEDAKVLARFLNAQTQEVDCYVCRRKTVIVLQDYHPGGQDDDGGYYDMCVISGRKVQRKRSKGTEYVCHECLYGKNEVRRHLLETVNPALQRLDELSL